MSLIEELKNMGLEIDEGLNRVMGDASLYEMMLGMFVSSIQENPIRAEDFDGSDLDELIKSVHTLKGVTGNLALMPLFDGYTKSLTSLRAGQPKEAQAAFKELLPVQEEILSCINRHR